MRYVIVAFVSILAILAAFWKLNSARDGLSIGHESAGSTPVTIFKLASAKPGPAIVIAHGFAGSQQLMQPFALTLARNGYVAVTFDFLGHGRNPEPLPGGLTDQNASMHALLEQLGDVVSFARKFGDGRLALLGHSMASDIVVRYAQEHPEIEATVAVSVFSPVATAKSPRNLLIIDGALEPSFLKDEGERIIALAAKGPVRERVTYGDFAQGTARRLVFAGGVEHIGVLYSSDSMAAALDWMNKAFARQGSGFTDVRGGWLCLLFLGIVALAWPLARLLPVVSNAARGSGLPWRRLAPIALVPALLTPLILWKIPTHFMPLLLGDYLVLHFALYGLLTAAGIILTRSPHQRTASSAISYASLAIASAACIGYGVFAIGVPTDRFVTNLAPIWVRLPLILMMFGGTLIYFLADEWLTRGAMAARGGYAFTKFCFLASVAFAIALNPQRLFFLIIIVPAILVLFLIYGLFSNWAYRRINDPLAGALTAAIAFAWAMAVTFPIVGP